MSIKKNKFSKVLASMESASFTESDIDGDITVSQEGIADVFKGIGQLWTDWRMARINKRPKLSAKELEKIGIWAWSIKRQIKKTYGEKRWVSQKINSEINEIDMSDFAEIMTLANTGKCASFSELNANMIEATENVFSMYEHIEKYISMLSKDINGSFTVDGAYDSIAKTVKMIGSPEQLIARQLETMPALPDNKIIVPVQSSTASSFDLQTSKKPAGEMSTLPALEERDFVGFSERIIALVNSLTDNNFFSDELFISRDLFVEKLYAWDQYGNTYNTSTGDMFYNGIMKKAHRERNTDVIQAMSPDFWNLVVSDLIYGVTAINLQLLKCELEYLNRHLNEQ